MTTSPGFMARTGLSADLFFRLNLAPGSAGDGAEPSAEVSCVSGDCAGSSERISVELSVKPEISLFSLTRAGESIAESDAALSITKRAASASSGSSMVMVTSASPSGERLVVPLSRAGARTREERRRFVPRGEGLWSDRSTLVGSPVKTFGRFSVRGPAAWRKDGGTGKNSNTMRNACKALRHDL